MDLQRNPVDKGICADATSYDTPSIGKRWQGCTGFLEPIILADAGTKPDSVLSDAYFLLITTDTIPLDFSQEDYIDTDKTLGCGKEKE